MAGDKEKMKQAGCDDYISKPLNSRHLQAVINHFLSTSIENTRQKQIFPSSIITNRR
jgi:DNA-binding response OmpR family regulator